MPEFGRNSTTTNGQETSTSRAWALLSSGHTLNAVSGDVVNELYAYLKSYNAGDFTCDIGIYEVVSGEPTNLVGSAQTITGNGSTPTWYGVTGLTISLDAGKEYCIAVGALTNGCRLHEQSSADSGDQSLQLSSVLGSTWNHFFGYLEMLCAYGIFTNSGGGGTIQPYNIGKFRSTRVV